MNKKLLTVLRDGGVVVMPTDTLYGIVGLADKENAVERVYQCKSRDRSKPCIILLASEDQLGDFIGPVDPWVKKILARLWPGSVSVIFPVNDNTPRYLHRGAKSLAFRVPDSDDIRAVINQLGPIIAPSANPEGKPPATNIETAKKYFGNCVDYYHDGGERQGEPSTLIRIDQAGYAVERKGAGFEKTRRVLQEFFSIAGTS